VGGAELSGVDLIELNPDGKISDLMVMIRPANVALAVGAEVARRLTPAQPSAEILAR
jgi:hypothetical protein